MRCLALALALYHDAHAPESIEPTGLILILVISESGAVFGRAVIDENGGRGVTNCTSIIIRVRVGARARGTIYILLGIMLFTFMSNSGWAQSASLLHVRKYFFIAKSSSF